MPLRVMIVEDEIMVALDLEQTLAELGHETTGIAADADGAHRLAATRPDLALVDLNLRDGPTGPQIGAYLARQHGMSVLFMTANPEMLGEGIAGAVGVLTKPCEAQAVQRAIDYAVRRRDGQSDMLPPADLLVFGPMRRAS